ncbi:hypothetical protein [Sphingomonas arenae]|uniref:hypothetical protein n=1 Tax=Sphingomonas arenae TaxID=2812555 RepID=UPI0019672272|nr:hypothetical protein [Sphingomonas arenae]
MTKQPMQADGGATRREMADENGELASRRDDDQAGGLQNTGESGGGAYPNPHTGKGDNPDGPDKFGGHGGQTRIDYHGGGQLGEEQPTGTPNSPTE